MELWKTIDEYPNYEVSNTGKVRNKSSNRILKYGDSKGYQRVVLCNHNNCRPASENNLHAYKTGLRKPPCPNPRKVEIVETGEVFDTLSDCARHIGGSKRHVGECLDGIRLTHKGYHFKKPV